MKKQMYLLIITIISFLLLLGLGLGTSFFAKKINVNNGVADFSSYDLRKMNNLVGQWEIYPNKLIASNDDVANPEYINLPNKSLINKTTYHYASYRVVLNNVPLNNEITISLQEITAGYAIYINKKLISTNNKLRDDSGLINLNPIDSIYTNNNTNLEIIIEVSNYNLASANLTKAPIISLYKTTTKFFIWEATIKALIMGALLFIALYQFIVTGLRNTDAAAFFFAIFALLGVTQIAFTSNVYNTYYVDLYFLSPGLIFKVIKITHYLINLFFFIILYLFFKTKEKFKFNHFEFILFIIPLFLVFINLVLPLSLYSYLINLADLLLIIHSLLLVIYSLINMQKQDYSHYIIISSAGFFISYLISYLLSINILPYALNPLPGFYLIFTLIYNSATSFIRESSMSNVEEVVELNKKIRDTEFAFLNSQIRSHFIYNSLNSIQTLINTNPIQAAELIEDFSMYLRTRLEFNKMPQLFNIEDELENIRTYLNIEKARFGKRVNYVYDLKVGDFLIPPLSVQPLVENAVKHGISMRKAGGTVTISTYEDENYIYIKVADDGIGFDPTTLNDKQRVGTENIRNRLSLHLNATLTITSQLNKGTESVIKIPKKVASHKKSSN